jgi:hypothetical protein
VRLLVEEEAPRRTRRRIVRGWLGEESFWRDVTTRTLAAAIVAVCAYVFALGAGYVRSPTAAQTLRGIWNVAGTAIVGAVLGTSMLWGPYIFGPEKHARRPRWARRTITVVSYVLAIFCGLALFQALSGVFNDVWWAWPFNTPFFHVPMANEAH